MKYLPVGQQSIEKIITNDFTYVDKTDIIYELIKKPGYYFFSRPRRFGKSLTCSTLDAIFQGKKELFDGLAISKLDYDWKKYPIVRLDFSGIDYETPTELKISLLEEINSIAKKNQIAVESKLPKSAFKQLITKLAQKYGPVVVIIDEYDKPILDHIQDKEMSIKMRDALKNFYGVLKDSEVDTNLRFLFMTGVSKFSKVSIFSELNNLQDLTMDERTATLCGYTQDELESVFNQHIDVLSKTINKTKKETLSQLKLWYNGFKFSKNGLKVYNPFSILNCLEKKDFSNYWFSSGTPTFMLKFIEKNPEKVQDIIMLESQSISATQMDNLAIESYFQDMVLLFLQAGYLTISSYDENERLFSLSYPNFEVRLSMTEQILEFVANLNPVKLAGMVVRFKNALLADDINAFCLAMKDFFVLLPHTVIINLEKYYQGIFFTITKLIGAKITVEDSTNIGFIDAVLEGKNNTYVIEFKRGKTPEAALKQIEDKEYFKKFEIEGDKQVVLVGMNFDYDESDKNDKGVMLSWKIKRDSQSQPSL